MFEFKVTLDNGWLRLDYRTYGERKNGYAAGAYYGILTKGSARFEFFGYGDARNTTSFLGWGLKHGLEIHERCFKSDTESPLRVWARSKALRIHLEKYVVSWKNKNGLNGRNEEVEAYPAWKEVKACYEQGRFMADKWKGPGFLDADFREIDSKLAGLSNDALGSLTETPGIVCFWETPVST